jgi:hypothetical protein
MAFVGRPPIYNSVEEIMPLLEAWAERIKSKEEVPTVTGLTLALGFADKSTLYDYAKKEEFSHPIKRALTIVELGYETALKDSNAAGSIFALKNMGWKDKSDLNHTNNGQSFQPFIFYAKPSE